MPNWCEGILKVRGSKENIIRFLENGICKNELKESSSIIGLHYESIELDYEKVGYDLLYENKNNDTIYIKNTHRCFVLGDIIFYYDDDILCLDIEQAWDIDVENFVAISKEYNIDIRINAFESGMCFTREVEIIKGKVTMNYTKNYEDYKMYKWEVYDPRLGG